MPKAEKLSTKRSAVLARERREREKENNQYNATLKEFVQFKYSHIIAEFNPFYENLKANHPANMVYTNTNEFRLWRKHHIEKTFSPCNGSEQQQQSDDGANGREQQAEQQSEQQDEQLPEQQDEQLPEQQDEQQPEQQGEQQPEQQDEQQPEQQDEQLPEQQDEQQPEQQGEQQPEQQDEQLPEQQDEQQPEQQGEQLGELARLVDEIVDEHEDEGIALDLYEELQADIELFDYCLEVELEEYM